MRVLFAIVRRIPILTVKWLYGCLDAKAWVPVRGYLHPMFVANVGQDSNKIRKQFARERMYIGAAFDPSPAILKSLVELVGIQVTDILTESTSVLLG